MDNKGIESSVELLIKNIDDIQECIENSNFELMNSYLELFVTNYTKIYVDIIGKIMDVGAEKNLTYWTEITQNILHSVKSNDVFLIMDVLYFDLRNKLIQLIKDADK